MKAERVLKLLSLAMLIVAIVFVFCALSNPALGKVFYIGGIKIGAEMKRAFYAVYVIVMVALFGASFFVKAKKK